MLEQIIFRADLRAKVSPGAPFFSRGNHPACVDAGGLGLRVRTAFRADCSQDPRSEAGCRFPAASDREAGTGLRVGGPAPGESDPRTPARGSGACPRLLGILRVRAGYAESLRDGDRAPVPFARGPVRGCLLRNGGAVRGGGGDLHRWAVHPPLPRASALAGRESLRRIPVHRAADLYADDHLPGVIHEGRYKGAVVGAYASAGNLSAVDSAYKAPAPGSESDHGVPFARRVFARSAAFR